MTVCNVPVPHDCSDGFLGAYWRRPEAFLSDGVRAAISTFSKVGDVAEAVQRLRQDLQCGEWQRRNAGIMDLSELDLGYRILIGEPTIRRSTIA